ncbi:hypothetical protein H2248_003811 [Termitomyces sp. 'cryptogamus']|nr:hypothetical protein H2248_003811 [Termitomyces sp. 'cryptogamus']
MHFTLALSLLSLASAVCASLVPRQTIPQCASACLFGPDVDLDGCSVTDNLCLCKSAPFISRSTSCIESACSGNDLQTALTVAQQLCASVGVTLTSAAPASTSAGAGNNSLDAKPTSSFVFSRQFALSSDLTRHLSSTPSSATSASASAPATTSNAATLNSLNPNALVGLAAVGLAALAL